MLAPEVVPVNGSTVRVLWFPPLQPNGAVTGYYIYVDDRLHGSVDNSSGSYLLGDLLPFTVYSVQVHTHKKSRHALSKHWHRNVHHVFVCFVLVYFRWKYVLCMHVCGVTLLRQLPWKTCLLTWLHHMHKFSLPGNTELHSKYIFVYSRTLTDFHFFWMKAFHL